MSLFPARRQRIARTAAILLASTIALTACGGDTAPPTVPGATTAPTSSPSTSATQDANSLLPPAEGTTQYPLTLETAWGTSELTDRPERVATVGAAAMDTELVLSLGAVPVTTINNGYSQAPWLEEAAAGRIEHVLDVESAGDFPYESIAAANPDLIVVFGYDLTDSYDKLAAIAPVVANGDFSASWSGDWRSFLPTLGEALDLQDAAASTLAEFDDQLAEIRQQHPEFADKSVSFSVYYGEEYGLNYQSTPGSLPASVLESIGLTLPGNATKFAEDGIVSDELIPLIDADVIIIHNVSDLMGGDATIDTLTGNGLFQQMTATKNDRVVITPSDSPIGWAMSTGGPMGSLVAVKELVPLLAEKLG